MSLTHSQKVFLQCLRANNMHISNSAKAARVARATVYEWLNKNKHFKKAFKEAQAEEYDWALSKLKLLMEGIAITEKDEEGVSRLKGWKCKPSETALMWYLEKLKPYGEVLDESENAPQNTITIKHTFVNSKDGSDSKLKF